MSTIIRNNVNIIRDQIEAKVACKPYFASQNAVNLTVTDQDSFPYTRYYRGIYQTSKPVVFEREAGWRQRHDACYEPIRELKVTRPNYCWQNPHNWSCMPGTKLDIVSRRDNRF